MNIRVFEQLYYPRSVPSVETPSPARSDSTRTVPRLLGQPPIPVRVRVPFSRTNDPEFRLSAGACVIGAGARADVIVDDDTISREHLAMNLVPEGVLVRDLGSRNGTYYNGHRITTMVLSADASLRLGKVEVRVTFDTDLLADAEALETYGALEARSPQMRKLFGLLRRLEGTLVSVLLVGESGTGKELIARAVHEKSSVSAGPLVTLNCGAMQSNLVRSELFGHRRGAFTGAVEHRLGAFQQADGGTLFLDEIGELPLDVQPVLLRALQEREVTPLGETSPRTVNARVIAATHRDLAEMVAEGTFREDLYYRLNVIRLDLPPLRERPEDVQLLALSAARSRGVAELPESVLQALHAHTWPGNVRELKHAIEAYVALGSLPALSRPLLQNFELALGDQLDVQQPYETLKREFLDVFLTSYLKKLMATTGGNVSQASRMSGLERSYLNKLVNLHRLR